MIFRVSTVILFPNFIFTFRSNDYDDYDSKRTKRQEQKNKDYIKKEAEDFEYNSSDKEKTSDTLKKEEELKHRLSQKYLGHRNDADEKHKNQKDRNRVDNNHSPERKYKKKERNRTHSPLQQNHDKSLKYDSRGNKERHTSDRKIERKRNHRTSDECHREKHSGGSRTWDNRERNSERNTNDHEDRDRTYNKNKSRTNTRDWDREKDRQENQVNEE